MKLPLLQKEFRTFQTKKNENKWNLSHGGHLRKCRCCTGTKRRKDGNASKVHGTEVSKELDLKMRGIAKAKRWFRNSSGASYVDFQNLTSKLIITSNRPFFNL